MKAARDAPRRDKRMPVMLSQAELDAIEKYRFENRVATRAEAVRRLVKIGLEVAEEEAAGPWF